MSEITKRIEKCMKGRFSSFLASHILMVLFFRRNEKILEVYVVNKTGILYTC